MSRTFFKINASELRRLEEALGSLPEAARKVTKEKKFLDSVGQLLAARGKQNLEDGGADGTSYTLLKPATRRWKSKKGYSTKPLQRTGLMRRSLSHEVADGELTLTGIRIIKHHQYGAPRAGIPERPVFTVSNDDREDIQDFLIRRFEQLNKNLS
ncbi:MAG: phage virion morphogenesis protein [Culturomica sp.]|jgi:phage virion morphogenesis protein|nr:phage virion morphogenesis protein [Culturomica sp.]